MPRNGTAKQDKTYKQSQSVGEQSQTNATNLSNTLTPIFQKEATDPTKTPLYNTLNTASGQSTGGAVAAQKGQTGLARLRTGNRGSSQTLMDDTVRNAMKTNSQNSQNAILGIQNQGMQGLQGCTDRMCRNCWRRWASGPRSPTTRLRSRDGSRI
jgi:hypothetical protein